MAVCVSSSGRVDRELEAAKIAENPVLNLNYCRLREIPQPLLRSKHCRDHLKKLYLKKNLIASLSSDLGVLSSLTELYLHSNNLTELPSEVALLPHLESLNVACNDITIISPAIGSMQSLKCLNVSRNCITHFPDELWRAPSLQQLVASANQVKFISSEIVHCQTLQKLYLDCNKLISLPRQITTLANLTELSVCGNELKRLPNDFSSMLCLKWLYVDDNRGIQYIPSSAAWVETLGVQGCDVQFSDKVGGDQKQQQNVVLLNRSDSLVPPLLELAARAVQQFLNGSLSPALQLPSELCTLLCLPTSLAPWLVPSGRCSHEDCGHVYFLHHWMFGLSSEFFSSLRHGVRQKDNLALSVDFCSLHCASKFCVPPIP